MLVSRIVASLMLCTLAVTARAQVENQDYQLLTPAQKPSSAGKIEVVEFFSYGCPHCNSMHPLLKKWAAQLPANAVLVRVPVALGRREWGQLSRAYYALEATGDLARLDDALFEAIHKERRYLYDEENLALWAGEHGVDLAKFRAAFNSPAVSSKTLQAEQMSRNYQVSGIPQLVVDGKYLVMGSNHEQMLGNARRLIDKAASTASR